MTDAVLDAIPLPALMIGAGDRVLAANARAAMVFPGAEAGRSLALVLRAPALLEAVADVLAGRQTLVEPRFHLLRDGTEVVWQVNVAAMADGRALCVFRDQSDEALAVRMRSDFVANVSHELRTPLTALIGFIETLKGAAKDDPAARERFLGIMEREAGRMNRLVRDLLQLSRVEAEERLRPVEPVDLAQLVQSVSGSLRPVADGLGARVDISGAEAPVTVPGDADQLTQVFANLIENALKYGAAGQVVSVRLTREGSVRGPAVRVSVQDRGEGIDEVHLPRLTERFYRVDSHRSREKGGTGLGLAIVKHIVARHRGWLKIDSKKGEGSTFSVILPEG